MKVVITVEDDRLPHVEVTDGIRVRAYDTTPEQIATLFAQVDQDAPEAEPAGPWQCSPILPPNTVFYAARPPEECVVVEIPAGHQPWVMQTTETPTVHLVPLPRLLMLFKRQGPHIADTAVVAVADPGDLTLETPVYAYPLSNVYPNTRCCWYLPNRPYALADIPGLARTFFTTPNNWDLYGQNRSRLDYRGLIAALHERPTFPPEWLMPLHWTVAAWIGHVIPHLAVTAHQPAAPAAATQNSATTGGPDHG